MKHFSEKTFEQKYDRGGLRVNELSFSGCTFDNCGLSLTSDPNAMSRIQNVEVIQCKSLNSTVGPCYLESVRVSDLQTSDLLIIWGAFFHRVEVKGKVGKIKINTAIHDPHASPAVQRTFDAIRDEYYKSIDWALDISQMKPLSFEVEGIPSSRIKRDPELQVVVSRKRLQSLQQLDSLQGLDEGVRFSLQMFVREGHEEKLLVAPTGRSRKQYQPVLESYAMLVHAGLAE
jgi:hypothetical protein